MALLITVVIAATTFFSAYMCWCHGRLVGKGRILTRPLWRVRPFSRVLVLRHDGTADAILVRFIQFVGLTFPNIAVAVVSGGAAWSEWLTFGVWALVFALYLDDLLTGDDERWARFKGRVRRAARWRPRSLVRRPVPA